MVTIFPRNTEGGGNRVHQTLLKHRQALAKNAGHCWNLNHLVVGSSEVEYMHIPFTPTEIVAGLVGLGLVAKGIMDALAGRKSERGCLYNDIAHEEIKKLIQHECSGVKLMLMKAITILEERK